MGWLKIFSAFGIEPLTEEEKKIEAEKQAKENAERQEKLEHALKLARQAKREHKEQQYSRMSTLFPEGTLMMFEGNGSLHVVSGYLYSEELNTYIPALINYEKWEECRVSGSRISHERIVSLTQIRTGPSYDQTTKFLDIVAYFKKAKRKADDFVRFLEFLNFKRDEQNKIS